MYNLQSMSEFGKIRLDSKPIQAAALVPGSQHSTNGLALPSCVSTKSAL